MGPCVEFGGLGLFGNSCTKIIYRYRIQPVGEISGLNTTSQRSLWVWLAGKRGNNSNAARILELAQRLSQQYVVFSTLPKRQVVDLVSLNLRLDAVDLCGQYRLPFSILVESHRRPLKSGRQDLNLRPPAPHAGALAKLRHAPSEKSILTQHACEHKRFLDLIMGILP